MNFSEVFAISSEAVRNRPRCFDEEYHQTLPFVFGGDSKRIQWASDFTFGNSKEFKHSGRREVASCLLFDKEKFIERLEL